MPVFTASEDHAFYADSRAAWRAWLAGHHDSMANIWLIVYRKSSAVPTLAIPDVVEEALCYGWIDSKTNRRDEESYYILMARRKPKSAWSAINKERVARLVAEGQMTQSGLKAIEAAKANGNWDALNDIDTMPKDLRAALDANPTAAGHFDAFPASARRAIQDWIRQAKQPATRQARIADAVSKAAENIRANQYRQVSGRRES